MTNKMHSVSWSADGVLTIDSAQDCVEVQPAEPGMSLAAIDALAREHCSSYAGPNYIVFTLEDLRDMIAALPVLPVPDNTRHVRVLVRNRCPRCVYLGCPCDGSCTQTITPATP